MGILQYTRLGKTIKQQTLCLGCMMVNYLAISMPTYDLMAQLRREYTQNVDFQNLIEQMNLAQQLQWPLSWHNGLLFYQKHIFLVASLELIPLTHKEFHDLPIGGHFGQLKTYGKIAAQFFLYFLFLAWDEGDN